MTLAAPRDDGSGHLIPGRRGGRAGVRPGCLRRSADGAVSRPIRSRWGRIGLGEQAGQRDGDVLDEVGHLVRQVAHTTVLVVDDPAGGAAPDGGAQVAVTVGQHQLVGGRRRHRLLREPVPRRDERLTDDGVTGVRRRGSVSSTAAGRRAPVSGASAPAYCGAGPGASTRPRPRVPQPSPRVPAIVISAGRERHLGGCGRGGRGRRGGPGRRRGWRRRPGPARAARPRTRRPVRTRGRPRRGRG